MSKRTNTKVNFQSDVSTFLNELETNTIEKSESRKLEEKKYQGVFRLRDEVQEEQAESKLWSGF